VIIASVTFLIAGAWIYWALAVEGLRLDGRKISHYPDCIIGGLVWGFFGFIVEPEISLVMAITAFLVIVLGLIFVKIFALLDICLDKWLF